LEGGVLLKYDTIFMRTAVPGRYTWRKRDDALPAIYTVERQMDGAFNRTFIAIAITGCFIVAIVPQELDETLWTGDTNIDFDVLGNCVADPPIDVLNVKMYRTQKAALADFPDLQTWDGPWD
jgi:hypothetical protein